MAILLIYLLYNYYNRNLKISSYIKSKEYKITFEKGKFLLKYKVNKIYYFK